MRIVWVCWVSLLLSNTLANAVPVTILGGPSCGQWVKERGPNNRASPYNLGWLLGFVSGIAATAQEDVLEQTDNKSVELWIDNYCRANPLKSVAEGADALISELERNLLNKKRR